MSSYSTHRQFDDQWNVWPGEHWLKAVDPFFQTGASETEVRKMMQSMFDLYDTTLVPENKRHLDAMTKWREETLVPLQQQLARVADKQSKKYRELSDQIDVVEAQIHHEHVAILRNDSVFAKARAIQFVLEKRKTW